MKLTYEQFKNGVFGVSKVILGIGYAKPSTVENRLKICYNCPSCIESNMNIFKCKECGCFIKMKVKLKDSECDLYKWSKE